jgi:putative ABC transport system permease protein
MTGLWRLWRISWRNIFRNKRRTLLTLMILILGGTGLILVGGFFQDLLERLGMAYIYSQSGHLVVNKKGFYSHGQIDPSAYLLEDLNKVTGQIEQDPRVLYTAPRLFSEGMLSTENHSLAIIAMGVIPSREKRMINTRYFDGAPASSLVEGEYLSVEDPYGILVGEPLQKALGLKVGDSVSFITQQKEGAIDGADFHLRGVFRTSIKEIGERSIKVNLSALQSILKTPDQAHSILVILDETPNTPPVTEVLTAKLNSEGNNFELIPWYAQGNLHTQTKKFFSGIFRVVQVIISIIFFFSIANTINMALLERMKEYGTMMAMGNSRPTIFQMILMESCFLGLVGSAAGIALGSLLANVISQLGIPMPPPPLVVESVDSMTIAALVTPRLLLESFSLTFLATLISSLLPAYRASHTRIIQALGYT